MEVPPGSTTVEIHLRATDTGTELHLVHRGLPGPMADAHAGAGTTTCDVSPSSPAAKTRAPTR